MEKRFGYREQALFAPEGGAGDGGNPAVTTGDKPAETGAVVAPWAEAKDQPYSIGGKPWWDSIQEEPVRELLSQKAYKTPADLALAYHSLNKTFSGNHVLVPGEGADENTMNEFYGKLGRPEAPEKYDIKFAEGADVDEGLLNLGKQIAFKTGLPPKAAQTMVDMWQEFAAKSNEEFVAQQRAENEKQLGDIKTKWGADFDKNIAAGKRVVSALGLDQATMTAIEANIGMAPMLDLVARIGRASDEGGLKGGGSGVADQNTPQNALAEIKRLEGDGEFQKKYLDKHHPEHKESVEKLATLYAKAGPLV